MLLAAFGAACPTKQFKSPHEQYNGTSRLDHCHFVSPKMVVALFVLDRLVVASVFTSLSLAAYCRQALTSSFSWSA